MHDLTKKRTKAVLIDLVISTAASLALEQLLRKKIKSEAFHTIALPSLVFWGLEYAQLRLKGQTVGQKALGIKVESEDGSELTGDQILKRAVHRDTISSVSYLCDRKKYDVYEGEKFPHDIYSNTVVKEA